MNAANPHELLDAALEAMPADLADMTAEHWQLIQAVGEGFDKDCEEIAAAQAAFIAATTRLRLLRQAQDRLRTYLRSAVRANGWDLE